MRKIGTPALVVGARRQRKAPLPTPPKRRLLCCNDDGLRRCLGGALDVVSTEWECFTVEDPNHLGIAALSVAPDVILLNAYAPGLNGFEACRRLRLMPRLRHTAIVLVIRESDEVFRTLIAGTGCSLLIATPIGGRRLVRELEAAKETAA
ncbi:MAG TPA: hypothetical protein VGC88_12630 [Terriglobales bacterium]|jgi:CheY-like chemotaxis protein